MFIIKGNSQQFGYYYSIRNKNDIYNICEVIPCYCIFARVPFCCFQTMRSLLYQQIQIAEIWRMGNDVGEGLH